jgi:hypothetical protein
MTNDKRRIDDALTQMANEAKEARAQWLKELAACREKGLIGKPGGPLPLSLTERLAHWNMAHAMLYTAVAWLKNGGQRNDRTHMLTNDLIEKAWPRAGEYPRQTPDGPVWACCESEIGQPCAHKRDSREEDP